MSFSSGLVPSTMTPPLQFFHVLATSSKTFSAKPSSLHPEPQCLPINVASSCSADDVRVKLCFLVKVRNAKGRRVAGGRIMGRTAAFAGAGGWNGLKGCAGVAKAGDEEGIAFDELGLAFLGAKKGGGGGLARLPPFSAPSGRSFRGVFLGLCTIIILAVVLVLLDPGVLWLTLGPSRCLRSGRCVGLQWNCSKAR